MERDFLSPSTRHSPRSTLLRIGHRGAAGHYPENTLLSFRKALAMGANGLECDVHVCKSGEAVVIHDPTLKRTTNGHGRVAECTLKELQALDAGRGERIPTLEELIDMIGGKAALFIEIKAEAAVPEAGRLVEHYAKKYGYEKLPVISFHFDWLVRLKKKYPNILIGATPPDKTLPRNFAARAQAAGMWSINPNIRRLSHKLVEDAHARSLKIITWTANSKKDIARAKALGVDGIISDFPDLIPA